MEMREILFRGKSEPTEDCKSEWIYGDLLSNADTIPRIRPLGYFCYDPIIPETCGQFTGLTDKNGKKIFEGDIIKAIWRHLGNTDTVIGSAKFIDASFVLETKNEYLFFEDNIFGIECEIIGNVHDNPDMLKNSENL